MRPHTIERLLEISRILSNDIVASMRLGEFTHISIDHNRSIVASAALGKPGVYVLHDQNVGVVEPSDNNKSQFLIRKADSFSVVPRSEILLVLHGVLTYYNENARPPLVPYGDFIKNPIIPSGSSQ